MSQIIAMRCKRSNLTTDDVKKAMILLGGVDIYGHSSKDDGRFIRIPKVDVYVEADSNNYIDLLTNLKVGCFDNFGSYVQREARIEGSWLKSRFHSDDEEEETTTNSGKYVHCPFFISMATALLAGNARHIRVVLRHLRTSPKIFKECLFLLNLVALVGRKCSSDLRLSNILIEIVYSIAFNKYLDPSGYHPVNRAVNSLLKIAIDDRRADVNEEMLFDKDEDFPTRMRAGLLFAKVVFHWRIENKQLIDIVRHLVFRLLDPDSSLQVLYGVTVTLIALDYCVLWPIITQFLPQLEQRKDSKKHCKMSQYIMIALLVGVRSSLKRESCISEYISEICYTDTMLYAMFGDAITPLQYISEPPIFKCVKSKLILNRLKLKIRRTIPLNDHLVWQETFGPNFDGKRRRISVKKNDKMSYKKHIHYYVHRNFKFCTPSHKRCASGDLFLIL